MNPSRVTAKVDPVDPVDPGRGQEELCCSFGGCRVCRRGGLVLAAILARNSSTNENQPRLPAHRRVGRPVAPETQPRRAFAVPWWAREHLRGAAVTVSERPTLYPTDFGVAKPGRAYARLASGETTCHASAPLAECQSGRVDRSFPIYLMVAAGAGTRPPVFWTAVTSPPRTVTSTLVTFLM